MKKLSVSNTGTNIKFVMLLLFFCFFFSKESYSQVLSQKDGIPIILFTEGPPDIPQNEVIKMKNLGVDIIHHTNVEDYMVERFVQSGLKVMPYQMSTANNWIYQYTANAHYTEWEAEGTTPDKGNVTLEYNPDISLIASENGRIGVKTIAGRPAANLIKGPGYRQNGHERYRDDHPIFYDADFIMRINPINPNINLFDPIYENVVVCTLKVVSHNVTLDKASGTMTISEAPLMSFSNIITIQNFKNYDWDTLFIHHYDWRNGGVSMHDPQMKQKVSYEGQYVQFIVDWAGDTLLQLSIDKVVVSDAPGRELKKPQTIAYNQIAAEVNSLPHPDAIEIFYSADEPTSIDNYEPYRMVDNMVFAITGNKRIITSLNTHYNGKYGNSQSGSFKYYLAEEFWKRANPMFLWLNAYPFHYYYKPNEHPNWREENINLQIQKIKNVSENDSNWGQDIQCTKWIVIKKDDNGK